jgi:hypothetical protein
VGATLGAGRTGRLAAGRGLGGKIHAADNRPSATMRRMSAKDVGRSGGLFVVAAIVLALLAGGGLVSFTVGRRKVSEDNERAALLALLTIASAEADFRLNDRDANGVNDYWTADVAGLLYLGAPTGPGRGESIRLIPPEIAYADASIKGGPPGAPVPYHGYFLRSMEVDDQGNKYAQDTNGNAGASKTRNLSKFAFCAYPAAYRSSGKHTYIINESQAVYRMDTGGLGVPTWPPILSGNSAGWEKVK